MSRVRSLVSQDAVAAALKFPSISLVLLPDVKTPSGFRSPRLATGTGCDVTALPQAALGPITQNLITVKSDCSVDVGIPMMW